jgi:monovalent cation/hydrogen antiporter
LITGLQARTLIEKAHDFPVGELLLVTAITAAIAIVARFVWIFPATYLPRWLIPPLARRDPSPPWQQAFVLGFTGVRGVVSLAAALAIPLTIENGAPFPHRDMILFATFGVIIITLVGQGMMLPTVIRWLGIGHHGKAEHRREQEAELAARSEAIRHSRDHLENLAKERKLGSEVVDFLNARHDQRARLIPSDLDDGLAHMRVSNDLRRELIAHERGFLHELLRDGKITDESRRRLERDLDLEEAAILARREGETPL